MAVNVQTGSEGWLLPDRDGEEEMPSLNNAFSNQGERAQLFN